MKELKSILKKAVEDNIISEKGGLNGIYDACKQLGYKSSKEEFEKKFFELVKSEIESSCMVNEEDLDSIAGGKGDIAKRLAAFGLALAGPAMGMSSQVGATFEGMKNLNVKAQFKTASKKVDDFVNKNPVKAAKIAAGVSVAATGALSAALVAAGFGVKALAARISACPLLAINEWDDQGDTKTFIGSFKGLDGIIGKQDRGNDGKVTSRSITESTLESVISNIRNFFGNHKLDESVETSKPSEATSPEIEENKTQKPEKKEESKPFNRIFQAVSRGNIDKLRELVAEEEAPEPAAADTQNQEELSGEAKEAAKAKETAKKEAKIEKIYKYWEGAKADLKAAIQKAVKDPSIAGKFVNLALELQKAGLLEKEDLDGDKVHENFTRAKAGMDDAKSALSEAEGKLKQAETKKAEADKKFQEAEGLNQDAQEAIKQGLEDLIGENAFENAVTSELLMISSALERGTQAVEYANRLILDIGGKIKLTNPSQAFIDRWGTYRETFNSSVLKVLMKLVDKVALEDKTNDASENFKKTADSDKDGFVNSIQQFYSFIENAVALETTRNDNVDKFHSTALTKNFDCTNFKKKLDKIVKVTTKQEKRTTTTTIRVNQKNLNLVNTNLYMKLIVKLFKLQDLINDKMQKFVNPQSVN